MSTMFQFIAVALWFVAPLWMIFAQPLDPIQHNALMNVYEGLGSFLTRTLNPV